MRKKSIPFLTSLLLLAVTLFRHPVNASPSLKVTTVATGLAHPWGIAFLPDGSFLVTERGGQLRRITSQGLQPDPIAGVPPVVVQGQGGLLDIVLHPEFAKNRWIYLSLSTGTPERAGTQVVRGRWQNNQLTELKTILEMTHKTGFGQHFGSRLVFDRQGLLYISTGDRGERNRAQDLGDQAGKVLRVKEDGSIPTDNPKIPGGVAGIFSWGHRNIQGIALHPLTGAIWAHEHGPKGGDELNILQKGGNYGWPLVSFGKEYSGEPVGKGLTTLAGLIPPIWLWTPSIAPSGLTFYTGSVFPEWRGNVFVGALAGQHLARLEVNGNTIVREEKLLTGVGRIRDVRQGPDGNLYLLTDADNGQVLRLTRG